MAILIKPARRVSLLKELILITGQLPGLKIKVDQRGIGQIFSVGHPYIFAIGWNPMAVFVNPAKRVSLLKEVVLSTGQSA